MIFIVNGFDSNSQSVIFIQLLFYLSAITKRPVMSATLLKKSSICFRTNNKIAVLKDTILSNAASSFSFILSLAEFLNSLKTVLPPNFVVTTKAAKTDGSKTGKLQNERLINYFELWCDYLFTVLCEGNIYVIEDVVVLVGIVGPEFLNKVESLKQFNVQSLELEIQKKLTKKEIYALFPSGKQLQADPEQTRKIGIINFSSSVLEKDKFKPKIHVDGLISGTLYNEGDEWHSHKILKSDIPTLETLLTYDTIILSGSSHSVNSLPAEIKAFKKILSEVLEINHKLKILGICFGHQLMASLLGSQIITKPLNKGPQDIKFLLSNVEGNIPYMEETFPNSENQLRLYKFHHDHVKTAPRGFVTLATSNKCEVDALISLDKRIFTMQFHPQFTTEYIRSYINRYESYFRKQQIQMEAEQSDPIHHKSLETFRRSLRTFLNWAN